MKKHSLIFTFLCLAITTTSHYCMGCDESKEADDTSLSEELEAIWTSHGYKHFPKKKKGWSRETVKRTRTAPAQYKPGLNVEQLERHVKQNGTPHGNAKIMQFNEPIGATSGRETDVSRVESNGVNFHGRPYTPEKAYRVSKVVVHGRLSPFKIKPKKNKRRR